MSETLSIQEMEAHVVAKSVDDPAFRQALLADPKATVEKEFDLTLPSHVKLAAIVSPANTMTLVLPHVQTTGVDGEMNDEDLEGVAGGSKSAVNNFFHKVDRSFERVGHRLDVGLNKAGHKIGL